MNVLISKMEAFLSGQEGIRQFQTYVSGPRRASVSIYFKPEYQRNILTDSSLMWCRKP